MFSYFRVLCRYHFHRRTKGGTGGQVQIFRQYYIRGWPSADEARIRIGIAKDAFIKRRELFVRKMNRGVKKMIVKTLIWSVLLYESETWTLRKEAIRRLSAFEMWMWKRMEKVNWKDKVANDQVLRRV